MKACFPVEEIEAAEARKAAKAQKAEKAARKRELVAAGQDPDEDLGPRQDDSVCFFRSISFSFESSYPSFRLELSIRVPRLSRSPSLSATARFRSP